MPECCKQLDECTTYSSCDALDPLYNPRRTVDACEGYLMVRTADPDVTYLAYDAASLALVAIGYGTDTGAIDCAFGPIGFVFPQDCGWQGAAPGVACFAADASVSPTYVCSADGGQDAVADGGADGN